MEISGSSVNKPSQGKNNNVLNIFLMGLIGSSQEIPRALIDPEPQLNLTN